MDAVHFLNIEYIVLRLGTWFQDFSVHLLSVFTGTPESAIETQGVNSPAVSSHIVGTLSFTAEQIALLGTALAIIFLAMGLYIRIKLELYEHHEFHKREAKYHGHGAGHGDVHSAHEEHHEPLQSPAQARWEEVLHLANSVNESDWRRAIMEADIMLGNALEKQGYRGGTVGERLKDANPLQMSTLDIAWQAHKVRNEIAHAGEGYHLSEWDTKATIDFYRRVLEELGFI
jgi:hypothetical protein